MDMQETIDSLRTVLESVIAPGVKDLRTRLDGVEKSVQEVGQRVDRLDSRVDHLTERMEKGFTRMEDGFDRTDARMVAFNARMDSLMTAIMVTRNIPDTITTRLDRLEREVQELAKVKTLDDRQY